MRRFVLPVLAISFLGCDPGTAASSPDQTTTVPNTAVQVDPAPAASAAPATFADTVEGTRPAVVNIFTTTRVRTKLKVVTPNKNLVPEERVLQSLGSGFLIEDDGHVLTNYHVIKGASDIEVRLFDERRFRAEVIGEDPKTDIALLRLQKATDLPVLPLGDSSKLRVGDWVIAIGNPLGLTSTVTAGIVSATGRKSLPMDDMRYQDFIQTDASINPGNSGGALLNLAGEVVGINSAVIQGEGLGFAIPINMVVELLDQLKEGGRVERSWLGIFVDPVPGALQTELGLPPGGALVKRTVDGGPASKAKLLPGDVILALDEKSIEDPDQLAWLAANAGVGKTVTLTIARGSERVELPLVLGSQPN